MIDTSTLKKASRISYGEVEGKEIFLHLAQVNGETIKALSHSETLWVRRFTTFVRYEDSDQMHPGFTGAELVDEKGYKASLMAKSNA